MSTDCERITSERLFDIPDSDERGTDGASASSLRVDGSPSGVFVDDAVPTLLIDPTTDQIVDGNERACAYYGYSRDQMRTLTVWDIASAPPELIRELMAGTVAEQYRRFRSQHRLASGEVREVEVHSGAIVVKGRSYLLAYVHDVTDQVAIEREVLESRARYRELFDQMVAGFALHEIVCDEAGHPVDYRFLDVNPAFENMTGLKREEMIGRTVREVMPATEDFWIQEYGRVALTGEPTHLVSYARALGRHYEVTAYRPRPGQFAVTFSDVSERQRIQESLKSSEERFRGVFRQSPIGIELYDPEGRLVDVNASCLEMFGASDLSAVLGFRLFADPNLPADAKARLLRGESVRFESPFDFDLVRQGGLYETDRSGRILLDVLISPLRSETGEEHGYLAQVQDVTARRAADEALAHERDLLRTLMDSIPDAIYFKDTDSRFTRVNLAKARHLGVDSPDDLVGRTDVDAFDSPFAQEALRAEREIIASGVPQVARIEHLQDPDGMVYWVSSSKAPIRDQDGRIVGIVGVSRDITEQHEAAEELRRSNQRLGTLRELDRLILAAQSADEIADFAVRQIRLLIPCSRASVGFFDNHAKIAWVAAVSEDGPYGDTLGKSYPLAENNSAEYERQGPTRYTPDIARIADPWPSLSRLIALGIRSLLAAPLIAGGELVGSLNLMSVTPEAFTDAHRQLLSEVADHVAIGFQQILLRGELRRQNAELEKRVAERTRELREANAELDAFARSVSHDLRAPLRTLRGYSSILLDEDLEDDERRDFVRRIDGAAERMDTLVRDVLAFSRASRVEVEAAPVDLSQALVDVLHQLEETIAERGARVEVDAELPSVRGHRTTITQVIANLVSNGVKFVPAGVRPEIRVHAEPRAGQIRVWIVDNGIGIAPENQERIFAAFERLHGIEEYSGSGIGLAIVKKGVERMGGSVGVESALGQGSRFWVELPVAW